jgi:hypothetical protein
VATGAPKGELPPNLDAALRLVGRDGGGLIGAEDLKGCGLGAKWTFFGLPKVSSNGNGLAVKVEGLLKLAVIP